MNEVKSLLNGWKIQNVLATVHYNGDVVLFIAAADDDCDDDDDDEKSVNDAANQIERGGSIKSSVGLVDRIRRKKKKKII